MTPAQLQSANIRRFETLLQGEHDAERRLTITRLLAEEQVKPLSAYPDASPRSPSADSGQTGGST